MSTFKGLQGICRFILWGLPKLGVPFGGVPVIRTSAAILGSRYFWKLSSVESEE